jgi:hypothetical protein
MVAILRPNALSLAYEDLIEQQERTLAAVIGFIRAMRQSTPGAFAPRALA